MADNSPEAVLARGRAAEALLGNTALTEVLDDLAEDAIARWRQTPTRDIDGRELLYAQISAVDGLRATLLMRLEHAVAVAAKAEKDAQRAAVKAERAGRTFGLLHPAR